MDEKFTRTVTTVTSILSSLLALFWLGYNTSSISSSLERTRIRDWQSIIVYQIILGSGETGISFDDVRSVYLEKVQATDEIEIPKASISDAALRQVILDLQKSSAIVRVVGDRFVANSAPPRIEFEREGLRQLVYDYVINDVVNNSGTFTLKDLYHRSEEKFKGLTQTDYNRVVTQLVANAFIIVGRDKKVYSITDPNAPPPPVEFLPPSPSGVGPLIP